jgi:hypothetical protein
VDRPAQVEAKAQILKRDKALVGGRNATLNSVPSPEEKKRRKVRAEGDAEQYSKQLTHAVTDCHRWPCPHHRGHAGRC